MTTPYSTRLALSEIPERLERLRVATTPPTRLADGPTPANVLNPVLLEDAMNNIPLTYLSPSPSPDEIIIRQRGRRRISLSWSPEKCPITSRNPLQKTPTKSTLSMTLRSSPRKRFLLTEFHPSSSEKIGYNYEISPRTYDCVNIVTTPIVKKIKLEEKSLAQMSPGTPLHVMLKGLSHDQLVGLIKNLVKNEPELEDKIRNEFPIPDIGPMEDQLLHIKRNIFKSLPASRLVKKNDSIAYTRAATHLTAFKKSIVTQSRLLNNSKHWDALLDYIRMAWDYVRGTPIWENYSHNSVRRHCFKILSYHCAASLRFGGVLLGHQRLIDLEHNIYEMSKDCDDITSCETQLNQLLQNFGNV